MVQLRQLQESFQSYINGKTTEMVAYVAGAHAKFAVKRLGIYVDAYYLRLKDTLSKHYPILKKLLGDKKFDAVCRAYIKKHPSQHFSIRYFGHQLADFLRVTEPYQMHPEYNEMALFEWSLGSVLDAPDSVSLNMQDLASIPQEQWSDLCLTIHPAVQIIDLNWNIPELWQALNQNNCNYLAKKNVCQCTWLIWRKELLPYYAKLNEQDAYIIKALLVQKTFGEIGEGLQQWLAEEEAATHAVNTLIRWLNDGFLAKVIIHNGDIS